MPRCKRLTALVLASVIALSCAGCMSGSVEELYSLPQMSEEYIQLQELIGQRLDEGDTYAAPTGGSNRQSVQLRDLDGDGVPEALAFLADRSHTPLVCIYRRSPEGEFYHDAILPGEGSAVARVDYADLNGDGASELILAWQGAGDLRLLSVYSLGSPDSASQECIFSAGCADFVVTDLDGNGVQDLLALQTGANGGSLAMYDLEDPDDAASAATISLSAGVTGLRRAVPGTLSDGTAALFVESDLAGSGLVTDVFVCDGGQLKNLAMSALGRSGLLRPDGLYAADVNGDGALEVPAGSGERLTWYSLNAAGDQTPAASSYYDSQGGWYLILTGILEEGLTVERHGAGGEEPAAAFIVAGDGSAPQRTVLAIYALSGPNRQDRAEVDGRFILRQEENTVYAAQLLTDELSREDILNNFYITYDQWQLGDL